MMMGRKQKWMAMLAVVLLVFQLVTPVGTAWASENGILLPPSNLAYEASTPDDGQLVWSAVYGATGYNVYEITDGQLILLGSTVTNSYSFSNQEEGTYTYVVSTLSAKGESGPCAPIDVIIKYPTMEAPASLSNTIQNGNDIILNWSASTYAESYHVYQHAEDGSTSLLTTTPSLSYTIINAEEGNYTYSVSAAHSLYGESTQTPSLDVSLVYPVITEPKNAAFTITNGNDITLNWQAVSYANQYTVYLVMDGEEILQKTVTSTTATFTNMPEGDYVYKIYASNDRFGTSKGTEISISVSPVVMEKPSSFTHKIQNINDVTLNWSSVPNSTAYKVYQIIGGEKMLKGTYTTLAASFPKLAGGDYTFEVHSYSDRFGESQTGASVQFTIATVTMVPPANFNFKIQNLNDIVLTWDTVPYAENYKIYQIIDGQRVLKSTITSNTTSYTNQPAGDYVFEITSNSSRFGESPASETLKVTLESVIIEKPTNLSHTIQNGSDIVLKWDSVTNATNYHVYQVVNGSKVLKSTVTGTTVTFTNSPAGEYSYLVHTYNSRFGESTEGAQLAFNLVHPTILSPANAAYEITSPTSFKLSWDPAEFATNYKVYLVTNDTKTYKGTYTTTSVSYSSLTPGNYTYEIHTYSSRFGESKIGSPITVVLTGQEMKTPGNFNSTISNGNDITLSWDAVEYANNYRIYKVSNGDRILVKTTTARSLTYTNQPEGDYHYEVASYSTLLGESPKAAEAKFTLVFPKMEEPNNFTATVQNINNVYLKWDAAPYATNYKVYEIINDQEVFIQSFTTTSTTLSRVIEGTHTYVVRSYSSRFGESAEDSNAVVEIIFPEILAPSNLTQTILNGNDIKLTWTAAQYANSYKIYKIDGETKVLVQTVSGTTHTFTNQPEGNYSFEVTTVSNLFGDSLQAAPIQVTVGFPTMENPNNLFETITLFNDIKLNWDSVPFATNYKIYEIVDGTKVLQKTVTSNSFTFTKVSEGSHTYIVHSSSIRFGDSQVGSTIEVSIKYPEILPPTDLAHSLLNGNDIKLTWKAATYGTNYKIYQIIDGVKVYQRTVTGTTTTFVNMPEGEYNYEVQTVSDRYGESEDISKVSLPLVFPIMQAPATFTKNVTNGNDLTLSWGAVTYATSYKVYQIVDGNKTLFKTTTGTTLSLPNMPEGEYNFEVHSESSRFGESLEGNKLTFDLVFPIMQAPAASYTITNGNDIKLTWGTVTYATSYKVYQIVNGEKILIKSQTGTSFTLPNQKEGEYTFEVHSISTRFGESPEGRQLTFNLVFPIMQSPAASYTITDGNDINLKWNSATYATAYKVYQIKNGNKELLRTLSSTTTKFTIMPEGDYEYVIHSFSDRFGESPTGSTISFNLKWPVITPPVLAGSIFNANNVKLTWNSIQYADEYRVYEVKGDTRELLNKGTTLSYNAYNLTEDNHSYQIVAYSSRFGEYAISNTTEHNIVYPEMAAPVASAVVASPTSARISWNFVTYANNYNIYEIEDNKPVLIAKNVNNLSYTVQNLSYKNHYYYVTAYSNSFGESDPSSTVMAKLINDTVPPVTSANNLEGWKNNSQTITLTATDDETGVAQTYYSLNEGPFVKGTSITIETEGTHKLSFYSIDKTGNKEIAQTIEVKIDKTAPVTTVTDVPTTWVKENVTVNLHSVDNLSDVAKTYYSINGGDYLEGTSFIVEKEGVNLVSFYSADKAGNMEEAKLIEVKIDKTAPITTVKDAPTAWVKENLTVTLHSVDNLSDVAKTYYSINGGEYVEGTSFIFEKEGVNLVLFYSVDKAGNNEEAKTIEVKIDKTAPITTVKDAPTAWIKENVTVNLHSADNLSDVAKTYYSINGGEYVEGSSFIVEKEGVNLVSFYSVDKAGNNEEAKMIEVKIDKTAPVTTVKDAPTAWVKENVTVTLHSVDNLSDVAKTYYSINGGEYVEGSSFIVEKEGVNLVSFYSADKAGNKEDAITVEVKIDKTAPKLTVDVKQEYELGSQLNFTYFTEDTLSKVATEHVLLTAPGEAIGKVINSLNLISLETPGVYKLTVFVTDHAGNTQVVQKQFTVYIPAFIEVTPKVIKGNKGVFTLRAELPKGYTEKDFDLNTAKLNGVQALNSNNGYYNQAKQGQFKFERSDFNWAPGEQTLEFRCYLNGYLVIGYATVTAK
jgi:large repetitive protein